MMTINLALIDSTGIDNLVISNVINNVVINDILLTMPLLIKAVSKNYRISHRWPMINNDTCEGNARNNEKI